MEERDLPVIRDMFLNLYQHLNRLGFQYQLNQEYLDEYLAFQLASRLSRILILEREGQIAGFIGFSAFAVNRKFINAGVKHYGMISEVYVQDNYRGQGLAKELVKAAERYFKDWGITLVLVEALMENRAAQSIYEELGFVPYYTNLVKRI